MTKKYDVYQDHCTGGWIARVRGLYDRERGRHEWYRVGIFTHRPDAVAAAKKASGEDRHNANAPDIKVRRLYTMPCPGTASGLCQVRALSRPDERGWLLVKDMENGGKFCTHVSHLMEK